VDQQWKPAAIGPAKLREIDAAATAALEAARLFPPGPQRNHLLKEAGRLRVEATRLQLLVKDAP
jgi:hypothetical protein